MKKLFLILVLSLFSGLIFCQNSGKFAAAAKAAATKTETKTANPTAGKTIIKAGAARESRAPQPTEFIYEDADGNQYQIWKGSRGGTFYYKYSETTGKNEKRYIKIEEEAGNK